MELNNKLRDVFFSLYRGQVIGLGVGDGLSILGHRYPAQSAFTETIELKPLSAISEEDMEVVNGFLRVGKDTVDYLRYKGYAVPFMNFEVNELVDAGWVRLVKQ
jgi:hypothetical protein